MSKENSFSLGTNGITKGAEGLGWIQNVLTPHFADATDRGFRFVLFGEGEMGRERTVAVSGHKTKDGSGHYQNFYAQFELEKDGKPTSITLPVLSGSDVYGVPNDWQLKLVGFDPSRQNLHLKELLAMRLHALRKGGGKHSDEKEAPVVHKPIAEIAQELDNLQRSLQGPRGVSYHGVELMIGEGPATAYQEAMEATGGKVKRDKGAFVLPIIGVVKVAFSPDSNWRLEPEAR